MSIAARLAAPVSGAPRYWLTAWDTGSTLFGTGENDSLLAAAVGVTLQGGVGDDVYTVGSSATQIIERTDEGVDTVQVWTGSGYTLSPTQSLENLTLMGSAQAWATGNDLSNRITGSSGANVLDGGKGNDVLVGGEGADLFVVSAGNGSDIVLDFDPAQGDRIRLDGTGFQNGAAVLAHLSQDGTDAVLDLGAGQTLVLAGVTASDLTVDDFVLPISTDAMVLTFRDDFDSFSARSMGSGTWTTRMPWGGDHAYFIADQGGQEVAVDPNFRGLTGREAATPLGLDPFTIDDGQLIIHADPVSEAVQRYVGGQDFTSGVITTESSFAQTYGYFEFTAALPSLKGAWPAFWMLPADFVGGSEIDLLESVGLEQGSIHVQTHSLTEENMAGGWVPAGDYTAQHRYGVLWTPYEISFYVDGHQVFSTGTPTDMNRAMYLIASLGMGGNWGGAVAEGSSARLAIDSIVAWQLPEYTLEGYTLRESAASVTTILGGEGEVAAGTARADLLQAAGSATLAGGDGDDTYLVTRAGTVVQEAFDAGIDTVRTGISFALSVNVENLVLTGGGAIDGTGNSQSNILTGNAGANRLKGGQGNDVLTGGGGADVFCIAKGDGSDIITDFSGEDRVALTGFAFASFADLRAAMTQVGGDVHLRLGSYETLVFRDWLVGDFAADDFVLPATSPVSGASIRWYEGGAGADRFEGTSANETFQGHGGSDTLAGGKGDDVYEEPFGATIIERPGEGVDTVHVWGGSYTLPENVENLVLFGKAAGRGNAAANALTGSDGNDTLDGLGGDDWLDGGGGIDSMAGGAGNDTYYVDRTADVVSEAAGGGTDTIYTSVSYTLSGSQDVEVLRAAAGAGGLSLAANALNNQLYGGAGSDTLRGGGGADVLVGNAGADSLVGGIGNDAYYVDAGDIVIEADGGGNDVVYASANYSLGAGQEIEFLNANAGSVGLALTGNELANRLTGGGGADTLAGGAGNDLYYVGAGDLVQEGAGGGTDIVYASTSYTLGAGQEIEFLIANAGSTGLTLTGNQIANQLWGGGGADTLIGGGGDDLYYVGAGDSVQESAGGGTDTIFTSVSMTLSAGLDVEVLRAITGVGGLRLTGNELANQIFGANGADSLSGGAGGDVLVGAAGADTLNGGAGIDILIGGEGRDVFVLGKLASSQDTISDFVSGTDLLQVSASAFGGGLTAGALSAARFRTNATGLASDAGDRFIYSTATGALFFDADGSGAGASVHIGTLTGHPALAASDFTIVA
ncbi:family 16 glycosylhydrolase [Muricoccus radiodurans]|uniref:family 16 glycosylhydrolase n=1 Tax=Muricoccus radiodurans TaxID=2231721 RepID=UPI003CF45601